MRTMIVALILAVFAPFWGCGSLLRIERSAPVCLPPPPRPAPELEESIRCQAAYVGDVLDGVLAAGAEAGSAAVERASRASSVVQSYLGLPVRRIPVLLESAADVDVPLPFVNPDFDTALDRTLEALRAYRNAAARHSAEMDRLRAEAGTTPTRTEVGSGWLGWVAGLGWAVLPLGAVAMLILVPNEVLVLVARTLVNALRGLLKEVLLRATGALEQVLEGVQRGREQMPDEAREQLDAQLLEATSPATRKTVALIKEDIREPGET